AVMPGARRTTLEPPTDSLVDDEKSEELKNRAASDAAGEPASGRTYRLTDATREPAINSAFSKGPAERMSVGVHVGLADRERRRFQLNVAPLGGDLAVGVFFDLTQLEKLERVRREFFANLSHELRTPLTAMLASLETLLGGAVDEPVSRKKFLETLHKHALRMNDLISDISDLSAIESGQVDLALRPVGLHRVVGDVITLIQSQKADSNIAFS